MTRHDVDPARNAREIAVAACGAFAAFFLFYTAAPVIFDGMQPSAGTRVAVMMAVVVAVQPFVLILGRWTRDRRRTVLATLVAMSVGTATLPFAGHWPGPLLLGMGFGVFVVTGTAWIKDVVPLSQLGRALGVYGFGSAIGGAAGAPIGLFLAHQTGIVGVAVAGALLNIAALVFVFRTRIAPVPDEASTSARPAATVRTNRRTVVGVVAVSATGQLVAVTLYAATLSTVGVLAENAGAWLTVVSAFVIQTFLSVGRFVGGTLCDRWPPVGPGTVAFIALVIGSFGFGMSSSLVMVISTSALVGLASGACQSAALTALMRRARTGADTDRASTAWNICFDLGLGLGAFLAGLGLYQ